MNEANFTKGPWESFSMGIIGVYIEGRHSWTHIATNGEPYEGSLSEEESNANAHLIAAAPELYEALEWLEVYAKVQVEKFPMAQDTDGWEKVISALAKARGETL